MLFTKITYLDNSYHIPFTDNIVHCEIFKDKFYILFKDGTQYRVYTDITIQVGDFSDVTNVLSRPELVQLKDNIITSIMVS